MANRQQQPPTASAAYSGMTHNMRCTLTVHAWCYNDYLQHGLHLRICADVSDNSETCQKSQNVSVADDSDTMHDQQNASGQKTFEVCM